MQTSEANKASPIYIGLTGRAGAGKDTVAVHIENLLFAHFFIDAESTALAHPIRLAVIDLFGLQWKQLGDRTLKEEVIHEYQLSPRQIMQKFGSAMRAEFGDDIFTRAADKYLSANLHRCEVHIITDIRYQNEAEWLLAKPNSILIQIVRPGNTDGTSHNHESEKGIDLTALGCYDRIHLLNNDGTLNNLRILVEQLVTKLYGSKSPVEVK